MLIQTHRIALYLMTIEERLIANLSIEASNMAINIMIARPPIGTPTSHTIHIELLQLPHVKLATIYQIGQHMFAMA